MKRNKLIALFLVLAMVLSLTACTTAGENVSKFFDQVGRKMAIWQGNDTKSKSATQSTKTALSTVGNLKVAEDGTFSFDAVENADNYMIYMYDAQTGDGKYASEAIYANGSTVSGNLKDYGTYGYGAFDVEVIAYPAMGDKTHKKSEPATATLSVSGAVEEVKVAYRWDAFEGTFGAQLVNVGGYAASSYPTRLTITLTNQADAADTFAFDWENVCPENNNFYGETAELTKDAVYDIKVEAQFNELVTNNQQSLELGSLSTSSKRSEITDGYGYRISGIYSYADFPTAANLNLAGGSIGTSYYFSSYSVSDKGLVTVASLDGDAIYFTAEPAAEVTEGSQYSFTVRMANADGVIISNSGWSGPTEMRPGVGTLELFVDGTFLLSITGSEEDPNAAAEETQQQGGMGMPGGNSGVSAAEVGGVWELNGDGTIHLSYNLSTAKSNAQQGGGMGMGFPG